MIPILAIDGERLDSWTSATVRKSLDEFAHSWSVTYTDKWAPKFEPWTILPGARVQFIVDGFSALVTGYVTRATWRSTATNYAVTAEGRSVTADLVDCVPFARISDQAKTLTPFKLITKICEPFNITVLDEVKDNKPLKKFNVELGETAFDAIDRVCRSRGILPMTRSDGALVLTKSSNFTRTVDMPEDLPASRQLEYSEENRFSEYYVYGQHPGEENFKRDRVLNQSGVADDGIVGRYRPTVILADTPSSKADLDKQALWERSVRLGRSEIVRYRVSGVVAPDGEPWEPGMLARMNDKVLRVNSTLLVRSVAHTWDASGPWTDLEFTRPEAYSEDPFPAKNSKGGW